MGEDLMWDYVRGHDVAAIRTDQIGLKTAIAKKTTASQTRWLPINCRTTIARLTEIPFNHDHTQFAA